MVVRIVKHASGRIDGISLARYHPGQTYDVPPPLADYLVLQGYAIAEMRRTDRSRRKRLYDRRRYN